MPPDITKLIVSSDHNAFKNQSVQRGNLSLPTSIPASSRSNSSITFNLNESANFVQPYVYATDYGDYFNFLDSQYHNFWRAINNSISSGGDFLVFSSNGLIAFTVRLEFAGALVTATLSIRNISGSPITINHPTYLVPVTFIEYTLDR